jgi:hypothetical protein
MKSEMADTYKLSLTGNGIKIDNIVTAAVAQQIVALAMGAPAVTPGISLNPGAGSSLSTGATATPKAFLAAKRPTTDVERVTVLAFYLDHFRGTSAFKTAQLTKLNTEAAGRSFANAAYSANNAVKLGYLTSAGAGTKQVTARGEALVEALPNKEAVKAALEANPTSRRRPKAKPKANKPRAKN